MTDETIFATALEKADPAERAAFLAEACRGERERRQRLDGLLAAHAGASRFLERPAAGRAGPDSGDTQTVGLEAGSPDDVDEAFAFLLPSTRPDSLGRIGHYEVLQILGKGGFGIVFRAFDDVLHRVVAVKVLSPHLAATSPARKRFLREARSSAQVRHENVVQVYEVGEQPLPYIAMEFIPGETLQQRLDRTGPIDVADVVRIGRQVAEGLAAAHATDLIHRDIKPGNILLEGGTYRVKITDFGLARAADDASISQSGIIAGTPMFMAPEQAKGETLDQRADLFSLGSVLYQMAAGRPPFRATGMLAVLKRVAEDAPRPIREIIPETPQWLCDIIAKLHAKKPHERYQSAREVADVLADCEAQLEAHARLRDFSRIPHSKQPAAGKSGRWKWVAAAALFLPVLTLPVMEIAGVTHLFHSREATPNSIEPGNGPAPIANVDLPKKDPAQPANGSFTDADVRRIAALPAAAQVEEVRKELKRCNPGFDGKVGHKIEKEVVTELSFNTDRVDDIAPVRVLAGLVYLDCRGTYPNKGKLSDLSPLKGMKLSRLDCSSTQIADLSPVAGLPLTFLHFNHNPVSDLTPLRGMPLDNLGCAETKVSDLSPLKGMKLKLLGAQLLPVTDLSPLQGMPLTGLDLYHTIGVTSLEPLEGMPLEVLNLQDVPVSDISALKGMTTLRTLQLLGNRVSDLSPLAGLRLTDLILHGKRIADLSPLKGLPLTRLVIYSTGVSDLRPLQGMPLQEVRLNPKNITQGMDVLRGIQSLKIIGIDHLQVWPAAEFWERHDKGEFKVGFAPLTDAEVKRIAALPAAEQVENVRKELMRRNPDFDGNKMMHEIEDGVVTEIEVVTENVTDISPIRVFKSSRVLECPGTAFQPESGGLSDLTPLKGMNLAGLTQLGLNWTKVGDAWLAPFEDCKNLTRVHIEKTEITDLALLKGMPLKELHCDFHPERDAKILRS